MILISSWSRLWPILWSHVLSREWRCSWSSADRRCSDYIWEIDNFIAYWGASYIRDLTVYWCMYILFISWANIWTVKHDSIHSWPTVVDRFIPYENLIERSPTTMSQRGDNQENSCKHNATYDIRGLNIYSCWKLYLLYVHHQATADI